MYLCVTDILQGTVYMNAYMSEANKPQNGILYLNNILIVLHING